MKPDPAIQHDPASQQFFTAEGARLAYRTTRDGELDIHHTFVPENQRGKGLAADLMKAIITHAEKNHLTLTATCSYAQSYLQRKHPHH